MNILVLNGPNLNLLGHREVDVYGTKSYQDLVDYCMSFEKKYNVTIGVKQSNSEGTLIDILHAANSVYDAVLFNAGAFTHYSYVLHDAIKAINIPVVEIHLSNLEEREDFRKVSVIRNACSDHVMGLGFKSYEVGLQKLLESRDRT